MEPQINEPSMVNETFSKISEDVRNTMRNVYQNAKNQDIDVNIRMDKVHKHYHNRKVFIGNIIVFQNIIIYLFCL